MVKFSRQVEYALGTLQFLAKNPDDSFSARELSEILNIPYEFLSKTLAKLSKSKILNSNYGIKGGYQLAINPKDLKFSQILNALDESVNVVECTVESEDVCQRSPICTIKIPMLHLQTQINQIINSTTLMDLINLNQNENDAYKEISVKQVLG